ncbi:ABC-type branched-subunit amino acid transport system substrate-binding protein [Bradyrhizobium diazoefficiens]
MQKLIAATAVGLALAATCGTARAQISDDVVKIGVLTDMSSLYADATGKGSLAAVEMAVADYGAKVAGKPVQVVAADHQNKPDVGVNIARNWYDNDKVDAIFDVPTSSVALPISALTRERNKININSGGGSSDITGVACSPNTVHWTYDTYALSNVAGKAMVKRGEDTWYFVTADYASAWRCSAMPPTWSRRAAARCSAKSAIRSTRRTSPPSCSRPRPPRPRWSRWPMPAATPPMR